MVIYPFSKLDPAEIQTLEKEHLELQYRSGKIYLL